MYLRLGLLQILATAFQEFDHGKTIEQPAPDHWNLSVGDKIDWECGDNLAGVAEIVSIGNNIGHGDMMVRIRKVC